MNPTQEYQTFKEDQQKKVNTFIEGHHGFFAFTQKHLLEGLLGLGLDPTDPDVTKNLVRVDGGLILLKTNLPDYEKLAEDFADDLYKRLEADPEGTGFAYQMFLYELCNHEYCITLDEEETLEDLGLDDEDFQKYPGLIKALNRAKKEAVMDV
jgi:hypothetical protein